MIFITEVLLFSIFMKYYRDFFLLLYILSGNMHGRGCIFAFYCPILFLLKIVEIPFAQPRYFIIVPVHTFLSYDKKNDKKFNCIK